MNIHRLCWLCCVFIRFLSLTELLLFAENISFGEIKIQMTPSLEFHMPSRLSDWNWWLFISWVICSFCGFGSCPSHYDGGSPSIGSVGNEPRLNRFATSSDNISLRLACTAHRPIERMTHRSKSWQPVWWCNESLIRWWLITGTRAN